MRRHHPVAPRRRAGPTSPLRATNSSRTPSHAGEPLADRRAPRTTFCVYSVSMQAANTRSPARGAAPSSAVSRGPLVSSPVRRALSFGGASPAQLAPAAAAAAATPFSDDGGLPAAPFDSRRGPAPRALAQPDHQAAGSWDVLGIGQAAVDYAVTNVDDAMLQLLNVPKGGRRVISVAERASVMESLDGHETQVSAGGSLANSLVGLAQLSAAHARAHAAAAATQQPRQQPQQPQQQQPLRVALAGCVVGGDALGEFAAAQLAASGVEVLSSAHPPGAATGTVMVFATRDAQRSFLSCFSSEDSLVLTDGLGAAVPRSRLMVLEGYLWELAGADVTIPALVAAALAAGTRVALTAGDAGVVARHGAKVLAAIAAGVDIFFANEAEAEALLDVLREQQAAAAAAAANNAAAGGAAEGGGAIALERPGSAGSCNAAEAALSAAAGSGGSGGSGSSSAQDAARALSCLVPLAVVTEGSKGAYIAPRGQGLVVVPPYWTARPPVDTCGAGDAFAAGVLHGLLLGVDYHVMGQLGAKTAAAVISRHTPQLLPEDADWVASGLLKQQAAAAPPQQPGVLLPGVPVVAAAAPAAAAAVAAAGMPVALPHEAVVAAAAAETLL